VGDHVFIDPHVLCTPAIGDLDGDGREEMVIAVSYFFDADYYDDARHAAALGGIERGKYVAGESAVFFFFLVFLVDRCVKCACLHKKRVWSVAPRPERKTFLFLALMNPQRICARALTGGRFQCA
jgi:hypothetical protein